MITIQGNSDDYVTFGGDAYGQVDCYGRDVAVHIKGDDRSAMVRMRYDRSSVFGVWTAEISPTGEDQKMPDTRVRLHEIRPGEGYSAEVEIDAPGAKVLAAVVPVDLVELFDHDGNPSTKVDWVVPS